MIAYTRVHIRRGLMTEIDTTLLAHAHWRQAPQNLSWNLVSQGSVASTVGQMRNPGLGLSIYIYTIENQHTQYTVPSMTAFLSFVLALISI